MVLFKRNFCDFCKKNIRCSNKYVPESNLNDNELKKIKQYFSVNKGKKLLVLTGAGISTESGIPDYRSPKIGVYAKSDHKKINVPVTYQEFIKSLFCRKKFWARHYIGYMLYESKLPNINHHILAKWEDKVVMQYLITQNVDNLHQKAGIKSIIQIHGNFNKVICLNCQHMVDRKSLQDMLQNYNLAWKYSIQSVSPDAYAHIDEEDVMNFNAPHCEKCNSDFLKPDVVMIGENVKSCITNQIIYILSKAEYLLVLGSSLTMYSAYRIVTKAKDNNCPIAIINIGKTRADSIADVKLEGQCGYIMKHLDRWMDFNNFY